MKLLIKYLSKLSLGPILIGLAGFVIFVSVEILYQLSDLIVRNRVSFFVLMRILYYYFPYFVSMGIPVGILLAIFWVLSQLSSTHEIIALQVHGISLKVLIVPFLIIAAILSFATYLLVDSIVPSYNYKADQVISRYVYRKPELFISENVITKVDENQYLYVKRYDRQNGILENIVLFRNEPAEEEIVTAKKVYKEKDKWYMQDGRIYRVDKEGMLRFDVKFEKLELDIKQDVETIMRVGKTPKSMKGSELKDRIKTLEKLGIDPAPWVVELHSRYSTSLGPLIIVLVGIPTSLMFNLKSKSWGAILTFVIIVLYQGSGAWISAMGKERLLNPILSAWLPNIFFSAVGLVLFLILDTRISYFVREKLSRFFAIAIFCFLLSFSSVVFPKTNLAVTSNHVEYFGKTLVFSGEVKVIYQDVEITCQELILNINESGNVDKLFAKGDVKYIKKDTLIRSQSLLYVFSEESVKMLSIYGKTVYEEEGKKHVVYFGSPALDGEKGQYLLKRAFLTTCELEKPHYRLQAVDVEIKENEYLVAYNAILYILSIPTIYIPVYFQSLKEGPDPFAVMFGFEKDKGLNLETSYNMQMKDGRIRATVGWRKLFVEPLNYSKLELEKEFSNAKWTLSYQIEERQLLPPSYSLNNVVSFEDRLNSSIRVYLTNDRNYFEYKINPIPGFVGYISRLKYLDRTTWYLPSLSVRNLQYKADNLVFKVGSLSHQSTVSYISGSLFDHLSEISSTGRFNASFTLTLPKPLRNLETAFVGYYSIKQTEFQKGSYLQVDSRLPFRTAKVASNWLEFSVDNTVFAGFRMAYDDFDYRISQLFNPKLTFKPLGFFSFSTGFERLGVFASDDYRYFSNSQERAKITFNAKLNVPTTLFDASTSYDLISQLWDDLVLKSSSVFRVGPVNLTTFTTTIYKIEAGYFERTDYNIELTYLTLRHTTEFSYYYNKNVPVDMIKNTLRITGREFYQLKQPDIRVSYTVGLQPLVLLLIDGRGRFKVNETSHEFSFLYVAGSGALNLSYKLSEMDPSISLALDAKLRPFSIKSLGLKVEKDLHCWGLIFEGKFAIDPSFSVQKLSLTFFIKEFPKKSFTVDLYTGEFDLNVF
ncbi:permease YjgP/YjgQ family protein [Pseudothermotoga thermarum DSM 5069]|uniref:Permease YjgP/YjgQ family protein n=1 Tax=Pseudothermotoga thermarum DSM 5069 TaxID=688269 RepID=F7YXK4_9THEM|nr:permease YjgP/YjgQ family protein [Pseudothermotoga thermarum DSM 5069]